MSTIYKILNYSPSPVSFATRERHYLADGGSVEEPFAILLDESELIEANYATRVFKDGFLFPEVDQSEEVYRMLKIANWQDILRDGEIRDIIMHPSADGLRKLIAIDSNSAFGRVWSILAVLRISGEDVPNQSVKVLTARNEELMRGEKATKIAVSDMPKDMKVQNDELRSENDELRAEIEKLKAELAKGNTEADEAPKSSAAKTTGTAAKKKPAAKG